MQAAAYRILIVLCLFAAFSNAGWANQEASPPTYNEQALKARFDAFVLTLDDVKVATDYPKVIKNLLSDDSLRQIVALKTLGQTEDPAVIPWLLPFLDSEDLSLRIEAGRAVENIISALALKRRDMTKLDRVVLLPLKKGDLDLRPFAWVALEMFRKPDDGNTHAYAATITRYLEAKEFEGELRECLQSKHRAVSQAAKEALHSLGFDK